MKSILALVVTFMVCQIAAEFVDVDTLQTLYIPRTYFSVSMTSNKQYFRLECTTCHQLSPSHAIIITLTNMSSNTNNENLILYLMDEATVRSSGFQLYYDNQELKWNENNLRAVGMQTWANDNDFKYLKYEVKRQSEQNGQIPLSWVLGIANQNYQLSQLDQQFQIVNITFDLEIAVDTSKSESQVELCPNECSKALYGTIGYCSTQLLRCICLTSYDGDDCRYYMPDLRYESSVSLTTPQSQWTYAKLTFIQSRYSLSLIVSASQIFFDIETNQGGMTAYFLEYPETASVLWQEIPSIRYYDHKYDLTLGLNSFQLPFTQQSANVFVGVQGNPDSVVTYSTHYSSTSSNKNLVIILFFVGFAFLALWICLMFIKYSKRRRRRLADAVQDQNQNAEQAENANRLRYKVDRYYPSITHLEVRAVYVLLRKYRAPPEQCVICLDPFHLEQEVRMMSCLHFFHTKCIDEWFKKNSTCPCCNRDFNRRANLMFNANEFIKIDQYDKRKMEEVSPRLNSSFSGWMLRREKPIYRHSCPALDFKKEPRSPMRLQESHEEGELRTARILSPPMSTQSIQRSDLFFKRRQDLELSIDEFQSPRPKKTHFPLFASQKLKVSKGERTKKSRAHPLELLNQVTENKGYKTHIGGFCKEDSLDESKERAPLSKHSMYPESMQNIIDSMRSSQLMMSIKFGNNRRDREIRSLINLSGHLQDASQSGGQVLNLKQKQVSAHTLAIKFAPIIPNIERDKKPHGSLKSMKLRQSHYRSKEVEETKRYEEQEETGQIQTTFENYMNEIEHMNNETSLMGSTPFAEISGIDKLKGSGIAKRGKKFMLPQGSGVLSSQEGTKGSKKTTNVLVLSNAALFESTESQQKSNPRSSYIANYMETYKQVMSPVREASSGSLAPGTSLKKSRIFPKQDLAVVRQSQHLLSPRRQVFPQSDRSSHQKLNEENATQSLLDKRDKRPISLIQRKLYDAVNLNQQALGRSTPRVNEAIQNMTPINKT